MASGHPSNQRAQKDQCAALFGARSKGDDDDDDDREHNTNLYHIVFRISFTSNKILNYESAGISEKNEQA